MLLVSCAGKGVESSELGRQETPLASAFWYYSTDALELLRMWP